MKKYTFFQKITGLSPYIWTVFVILPFYFILQSSSMNHIIVGSLLTILFFIFYRFAFVSTGKSVYVWTALLIVISLALTTIFNYIYFAFYFAFFIAYFIGNIQKRLAFFTLYAVHLISTVISVNFNVVMQEEIFLKQLPFIFVISISVIVLPFSIYNRKKRDRLEEQLEDANKRISELVKQEERQRIARDLHDTLGQKLSLIGLKSDLARKLITKDPEKAKSELKDVQQTARTALNEVRNMVSQMRGIRLSEELKRVQELLEAAEIKFVGEEGISLENVSLLIENILSMCLKEAVTNVVKHSQATVCTITLHQSAKEVGITVEDNGVGINTKKTCWKGNGLLGMKERLEFVNGHLDISSQGGTIIHITVPNIVKHIKEEQL
ncbi:MULTISPECIES: sensor histidine kinase [Priestia]|jgi:two-component system, NarL family, sensor histidine kinase DesK|uniref:sensor histidine kinase n=1 Tax=Priestia TaxID=2800373 RepID=UPI0005C547B9|nr:sensor histidine kinase [Priestia megaterium]MCF8888551.1 sensor histidine kinase [Priestia megaterium]NEW01299.1 sensor histidine kinase [Priestia megaterium]